MLAIPPPQFRKRRPPRRPPPSSPSPPSLVTLVSSSPIVYDEESDTWSGSFVFSDSVVSAGGGAGFVIHFPGGGQVDHDAIDLVAVGATITATWANDSTAAGTGTVRISNDGGIAFESAQPLAQVYIIDFPVS